MIGHLAMHEAFCVKSGYPTDSGVYGDDEENNAPKPA